MGWTVYAPWDAKVSKKHDGSLRAVAGLSRPVGAVEVLEVGASNAPMQQAGRAQVATGAMGSGATPVQVSLPLEGQPITFEKLLALDERLWVSFDYRGLK